MGNVSAWEQFVRYGERADGVRRKILDSWIRCKQAGISPNMEEVSVRVNTSEVSEIRIKNKLLIDSALPVMNELYNRLKGGGYLLMLADANGFLLQIMADRKAQKIADRSGVQIGVRWTEDTVGSTGLSIALRIRSAMATSGHEHFCMAFRVWDCSACPIYVDHEFVGVFDICRVGPGNDIRELYALAVAGAQAISERIKYQKVKEAFLSYIQLVDQSAMPKDTKKFLNDKHGIILGDQQSKIQFNNLNHYQDMQTTIMTTKRQELNGVDEEQSVILNKFKTASEKFRKTLLLAAKAAKSDACILIQGESGTGKDYMAKAVHEESQRNGKPFISINCAALPRDLIVSELFGYAPGAFTGARQQGNEGKIEAANGGTLFLDEIAEMPVDLQAVLLRVLEDNYITRIGTNKQIPIDVRFIAATNKDLRKLVQDGAFREDLYYRINIIPIYLPPLRERKQDIELLINTISSSVCAKAKRDRILFTPSAIRVFCEYSWPGNIRELRNIIERIVYLHKSQVFDEEDARRFLDVDYTSQIATDECEQIMEILHLTNGNRAESARILGISRSTLYRKLKQYRIWWYPG